MSTFFLKGENSVLSSIDCNLTANTIYFAELHPPCMLPNGDTISQVHFTEFEVEDDMEGVTFHLCRGNSFLLSFPQGSSEDQNRIHPVWIIWMMRRALYANPKKEAIRTLIASHMLAIYGISKEIDAIIAEYPSDPVHAMAARKISNEYIQGSVRLPEATGTRPLPHGRCIFDRISSDLEIAAWCDEGPDVEV